MLWGPRASTHLTATYQKRQSEPNCMALLSSSWAGHRTQGWSSRQARLGPKAWQLKLWKGRALLTLPGMFLTSQRTGTRSMVKPDGGREPT